MIFRLPKLSGSNSFFLFGARGTGKTSLVKERFLGSTTLYLDLLQDAVFGEDPIYIEIKSTKRILPDHTNHLERLAADHPKGRFLCLSFEKTPRQIGPVRALHWQDGLRELGLRS